jgi:hypothetical protein
VATRRTLGTRAKDSDRADTCQVLDSALAKGQLSMEEHRQRVGAATNATTLGELQSLVTDLQPSNPAHSPATRSSRLRRGPVVIGAVTGVVVAICAAIAWAKTSDTGPAPDATTPTPSAEAGEPAPVVLAPPRQLHTADGMASLIEEIRKRFGDTMGFELAISPDEAVLARPNPADDRSKLIYSFKGGWGDPDTRPRSDTDNVTDLGAFDVQAAAAALQGAPDALRIAPADVSDTVIDIDHISDTAGLGALELLVKVTTTSGANGFIYLDGASNVKRVEYPG